MLLSCTKRTRNNQIKMWCVPRGKDFAQFEQWWPEWMYPNYLPDAANQPSTTIKNNGVASSKEGVNSITKKIQENRKPVRQNKYTRELRKLAARKGSKNIKSKQAPPTLQNPDIKKLKREGPWVSTPTGTKPVSAPTHKRFISEPLGSREDFKKDSGRNWSQSKRPKF